MSGELLTCPSCGRAKAAAVVETAELCRLLMASADAAVPMPLDRDRDRGASAVMIFPKSGRCAAVFHWGGRNFPSLEAMVEYYQANPAQP